MVDLQAHAKFAMFCYRVLQQKTSGFGGLRQAVERSPEVQTALGLALSAGLAGRVQAMQSDAAAALPLEAADHIAAAAHSLWSDALCSLWADVASGNGSALQQQAAAQLVDTAESALQLAVARPGSFPPGTHSVQYEAHVMQLALLPRVAIQLGGGGCRLATRARHAVLRAAPGVATALRAAVGSPEGCRDSSTCLLQWCLAIRALVMRLQCKQQTVALQPLLQQSLAAAQALLRLLPLLDSQRQQLRQISGPEERRVGEEQLFKAGSTAIEVLLSVSCWAAGWARAVPAAQDTPALRQQLWQLLATATKLACAALDA